MLKTSILTTMGGSPPNYIEDVFSTYLYTGNGSTQTITNNIDLSTKGGLVWIKSRNARTHVLFDTARGTSAIESNTTNAQSSSRGLTAYTTSGFSLNDPVAGDTNATSVPFASWTFRKQPKFFDVVTYTGNGTSQNIAHSLGSVPGCIMVKATSGVSNWFVYHRSLGNANLVYLNATSLSAATTIWNSTDPTSTQFSINGTSGNASGVTYVAYLFAHDAGGFGLSGADNVISCGSYTTNGSAVGTVVNLGWEPQCILIKSATGNTADWCIVDNMRGFNVTGGSTSQALRPNLSSAESGQSVIITNTGFQDTGGLTINGSVIYIAIRRGPMKVPTDATKVFYPSTVSANGTAVTTGFRVDLNMDGSRTGDSNNFMFIDRLRGIPSTSTDTANNKFLISSSTVAESTTTVSTYQWWNTGYVAGPYGDTIHYSFQRAPGFFDEVCYTGTGANTTVSHNLGAVPELIIVKRRDGIVEWKVYSSGIANTEYLVLNSTAAKTTNAAVWNSTTPTSTVFSLGTNNNVNGSTWTYVAYLFATCPGVSKVGSYTGTGATQTINCGFTGGARFVMIKRVSSTGDWYVWDTARGMVAGTDPSLAFNLTTTEVNANSVYTTTGGFQIVATQSGINGSGSTYIYLAIA